MFFKRLRSFILYLGIGCLFHAIFQGQHLDVTSAWTWAWLLAWPLALIVQFLPIALFAVLGLIIVFLLFIIVRSFIRRCMS